MAEARLDDLDRRLLEELSLDARLTQVALAARVGLSRSAVQERLKRLERAGVILGYTLRLGQAPRAGLRAYLLVKDNGPDHARALRALEGFPEVRVADSVAGEIGLVLQVEAASVDDLNRLRDEVGRLPGVASTQTLLVMKGEFSR
ncbi:MAG TPA: Lrp/AsnC family transcriptional regulator [Holophagaceae bacterium]|jgi:DNA-binding Lrp family transcriptional regulator|nr:Lrp/AsnC family transcriptional regulator [Holophagaceae bacterium]